MPRASEPLPGHGPVRLPGDGRAAAIARRRTHGIDLDPALRADLEALAREYGPDTPFDPGRSATR